MRNTKFTAKSEKASAKIELPQSAAKHRAHVAQKEWIQY